MIMVYMDIYWCYICEEGGGGGVNDFFLFIIMEIEYK